MLAIPASTEGAASEAITVPSLTVPTVNNPDALKAPETVVAPAANVPVVLKFSLSKLIAPVESLIEPVAKSNVETSRSVVISTLAGNPNVTFSSDESK